MAFTVVIHVPFAVGVQLGAMALAFWATSSRASDRAQHSARAAFIPQAS